jgi:hypothetical protein
MVPDWKPSFQQEMDLLEECSYGTIQRDDAREIGRDASSLPPGMTTAGAEV